MFVSHQWAAVEHPDPDFSQFTVLQEALRNVMQGSSLISGTAFEIYGGQQSLISAHDLCSEPLFLWYDFFSCPQSYEDPRDARHGMHGEDQRILK